MLEMLNMMFTSSKLWWTHTLWQKFYQTES